MPGALKEKAGRQRGRTIRSHLLVLVFWVVLPVVAFAIIVSFLLIGQTRDATRSAAIDRARATMTAVDAELQGSVTTLQALATSKALQAGDFAAFHSEATRVAASQPSWTGVTLSAPPDFRQVVNTSRPYGSVLPKLVEPSSADQALRTGMPAVGSVAVGSVMTVPLTTVRVPVIHDGRTAYVLTAVIRPESFEALIRLQNLPRSWVAGIIDRHGRFVARLPSRPAGTVASDTFRAATRGATEGWVRGATLEGTETYMAYARSGFSDWSIGFAIPASESLARERRIAFLLAFGVLVSIAIALVAATFTGRRIAGPIAALAATARSVGKGSASPVPEIDRVTEVAEVAEALRQAGTAVQERQALIEREKAALVESDRAKDEFIAMLSHELRNPLSALTSAAHLLKIVGPGGKGAEHARGVIERQTRHMTRLIEDLLDINRVAMGKVTLICEPLDLAALVHDVVRTWRASDRLGGHTVEVKASPVWIDADRSRVEQVFANLLDNALKFTPAGKAVRVKVDRDGSDAVLSVADEGEGIDPAIMGRIFGLFVQGPQELHRPSGGLGVGLALVKGLVELHGGSVAAASAGPGQGSTFTVRLPAADPPGMPKAPATASAGSRRKSKRILVVEDNEDARQMLRRMLELAGHAVREAATGRAGLASAASDLPEVMIIDIGLPDISGYEVSEGVRALNGGEQVLLIALTGYGQAEDKRRALETGFDAHATKPVLPEHLAELVDGAVRPLADRRV